MKLPDSMIVEMNEEAARLRRENQRLLSEVASLRQDRERLREALLRHGRHDDGEQGEPPCRANEDGPGTCTCGLETAWAARVAPPAHQGETPA